MPKSDRAMMRGALLLLAAALAACGAKPDQDKQVDTLDAELTGANAASPAKDPALAAALHDQIMVDPALTQQSNRDALRPPPRPASGALPSEDIAARPGPAEHDAVKPAPAAGACPQCLAARRMLTLGALAEAKGGPTAACAKSIGYSAIWATRLPGAVPLYPDARVLEAAGADGPNCKLRIVSFASSTAPAHLLDWYFTHASATGFSVEHGREGGADILAGTRAAGGAFYVTISPRAGGGGAVDLMADAG